MRAAKTTKRAPLNSLGKPWQEGERWTCARCGGGGPDRDDLPVPPCLPREGAHISLAYHELNFEPAVHAAAIKEKHDVRG